MPIEGDTPGYYFCLKVDVFPTSHRRLLDHDHGLRSRQRECFDHFGQCESLIIFTLRLWLT